MAMPNYIVIDLETSVKNRGDEAVGDMAANPFYPDNKIVMTGWTFNHQAQSGTPKIETTVGSPTWNGVHNTDYLVVGQNIKFDLLYLYRDNHWREWAKHGRIWDTMVVEYLLTGQQEKYASLGDKRDHTGKVIKKGLATKYGGVDKIDKIKGYWDAGMDTEDIPKNELDEYLEGDVRNTEIVFRAQYLIAKRLGMLPLIESQMDALLATTEMEWNGFNLDIGKAYILSEEVKAAMMEAEKQVLKDMRTVGIKEPNPHSNVQISLMLFGGTQTTREQRPTHTPDHPQYRYKGGAKAGQVRTRLTDVPHKVIGLAGPLAKNVAVPTTKAGVFKTGEEQLKAVGTPPALNVLELRLHAKDLKTHYVGYAKLYWPNHKCMHGSFSHCATNTGRLSSSKPNLQNIPK